MNSGNRLNTFLDASGKISVSVFSLTAPNAQEQFADFGVGVADDMVVVGGGGIGAEFPEGALLTASYPNSDFTGWLVSSKDHERPNPHFLTAYAVGMRIQGMTRNQMVDSMFIGMGQSGLGAHPTAVATLPDGYVLIGGGFNVDWKLTPQSEGNLATASFPESNFAWKASSKDHDKPSPANLTTYAIGIKRRLSVGNVEVNIQSTTSGATNHPASTATVAAGYALTGGGAEAHWRTAGSLLWKLQPTTSTGSQDFTASSKDQVVPESTTITTYALGIKLV